MYIDLADDQGVRGGEALPFHGGSGLSGGYNAITPAALTRNGGLTPACPSPKATSVATRT